MAHQTMFAAEAQAGFIPTTPQGDGNFLIDRRRYSAHRLIHTHYPARGRKQQQPVLFPRKISDRLIHTHYPARGRKPAQGFLPCCPKCKPDSYPLPRKGTETRPRRKFCTNCPNPCLIHTHYPARGRKLKLFGSRSVLPGFIPTTPQGDGNIIPRYPSLTSSLF